jgi:hypothetical protein
MMNLDFKDVTAASRQVATYSAMNPILWKTAICSPLGIVCASFASAPLSYMIFALSALPILVGCWGFVYFAQSDPKRLQSEGHIQQMEVLSRIGGVHGENRIDVVLPADLPLIENPSKEDEI